MSLQLSHHIFKSFVEGEKKLEEILLTAKSKLTSSRTRQDFGLPFTSCLLLNTNITVQVVGWHHHAPTNPQCPTASLEVLPRTTKCRAHKADSLQVTTTCRFPKVCPPPQHHPPRNHDPRKEELQDEPLRRKTNIPRPRHHHPRQSGDPRRGYKANPRRHSDGAKDHIGNPPRILGYDLRP